MRRHKKPNQGLWSPPGGKLLTSLGESPFECAIREAKEEVGLVLTEKDLSMFGYVSEKNYEGDNHWLMFLFDCLKPTDILPQEFHEGYFSFFPRTEIDMLDIPSTDHQLVWPYYDQRHSGFWGIRADCSSKTADLMIEANPTF